MITQSNNTGDKKMSLDEVTNHDGTPNMLPIKVPFSKPGSEGPLVDGIRMDYNNKTPNIGYTVTLPTTSTPLYPSDEMPRTLRETFSKGGIFATPELSPEASELVEIVSNEGITPRVREAFHKLRKEGKITYKALLRAWQNYLNSQR